LEDGGTDAGAGIDAGVGVGVAIVGYVHMI